MSDLKIKQKYFVTRWLFMRAIGFIYLLAFFSFGTQILGLIGHNGILPVHDFLEVIKQRYGAQSYGLVPTVFWINSSDAALTTVCWVGMIFSILLMIGIAPIVMSVLLWALYLSLTVSSQDFMGFQWDSLLLETGFIAIFWAEPHLGFRFFSPHRPSPVILLLLRVLLFKLMFSSGVVKLTSGDPVWHNLTALTYHYMTQPLPGPLSWFVHQWPVRLHKLCTYLMFFIELILPFFIFLGKPMRVVSFVGFLVFQLAIILTGNYGFFNLLAMALSLSLLDDDLLKKILPKKLWLKMEPVIQLQRGENLFLKIFFGTLSGIIFLINLEFFPFNFNLATVIKPFNLLLEKVAPFRTFNHYGLFAVMTTSRPEIVIEGSLDGKTWKEYEFCFKPGGLEQIPKWVVPHQPRLDWQMWFAALGGYKGNLWLIRLMEQILLQSEPVMKLLASNPFKETPPKYIRAIVYEYSFTDSTVKKKNGQWWQRKLMGLYCPVLQLYSPSDQTTAP